MGAGNCPHCGGPNPFAATQCEWCGSALPLPSRPGPAATLSVEPGGGYRPIESPDPLSAHRTNFAPVAVGVIVVLMVIFVIALMASSVPSSSSPPGFPTSPPVSSVVVTEIYAVSPDDVCGLNGSSEAGFSDPGGTVQGVLWTVVNTTGPNLPCTITSLSTNTSGFLVFAQTPVTLDASDAQFSFELSTPSSFDGPLYIELN
jgi:hypothetical protein